MKTIKLIFLSALVVALNLSGAMAQQTIRISDQPLTNSSIPAPSVDNALPTFEPLPMQWQGSQAFHPNSIVVEDAGSFGAQSFGAQPAISGPMEVATTEADSREFPTVEITGFFQLDGGYFSQDVQNQLTIGDIEDGLGFRRARLAAKGNVTERTSYNFEFDFAQSQARFVDVWLQVNDTRLGNVRIGRFRQPFGMSELTSVRDLPFLERPVTFTQSPFRQTGIMLFGTTAENSGTWAAAGYRFLSDNFGNVFADDGGYGLATRLTRVVSQWGSGNLFHLGFDYSYNDPGRGLVQFVSTNEVFLGQNPNLGPSGLSVLPIIGIPPFVNTGPLPTDTAQLYSAEAALALGRLAIQSEARFANVEQPDGQQLSFPGAYVTARLMLTGEQIPYNKNSGVFGRIVPDSNFDSVGGRGAWELLGRISHIDLNDGAVLGRRLTNYTVGLNWYWNEYVKVQFNWINSQLDDSQFDDSTANAFVFRAQLDF